MRKISLKAILAVSVTIIMATMLAAEITWALLSRIPLGTFRGFAMLAAWVVIVHVLAILTFRIFIVLSPLPEGPVAPGSTHQFTSDVYLLSNILCFHPMLQNPLVPDPVKRLLLQGLGARMGSNSFSAGLIQDPCLTELGENTLVGENALVIAHAIEGKALSYRPVRIGSGVTIGARSIIMPGVTIDDDAIVAAGAVVPKGSHIGRGEVWGGLPARRIKRGNTSTDEIIPAIAEPLPVR